MPYLAVQNSLNTLGLKPRTCKGVYFLHIDEVLLRELNKSLLMHVLIWTWGGLDKK